MRLKNPQPVPHSCVCGNASYNAVFNYMKQNVPLDVQTSRYIVMISKMLNYQKLLRK